MSSPLTPAQSLTGVQLPNGWTVEAAVTKAINATGGCFSASYTVVHDDGRRAFMKAIDYVEALRAPDRAEAVRDLTERFVFERDLAASCAAAGMSRVVTALEHGQVDAPGGHPLPEVSFLIFELGDGDVRKFREISSSLDVAWIFRSLHGVALGLQQLHTRGIAHQDLKPSNVMTFGPTVAKVGDLGRASANTGGSPYDGLVVPGDLGYAPIELLYRQVATDWDVRRRAGDLFQLGSFLLFQFTAINANGALIAQLDPAHRPGVWGGSYADVLPFVRSAVGDVSARLPSFSDDRVNEGLRTAFRELCEPDPLLRGHPKARARVGSNYSLERYVSIFDALAARSERLVVSVVAP